MWRVADIKPEPIPQLAKKSFLLKTRADYTSMADRLLEEAEITRKLVQKALEQQGKTAKKRKKKEKVLREIAKHAASLNLVNIDDDSQ